MFNRLISSDTLATVLNWLLLVIFVFACIRLGMAYAVHLDPVMPRV